MNKFSDVPIFVIYNILRNYLKKQTKKAGFFIENSHIKNDVIAMNTSCGPKFLHRLHKPIFLKVKNLLIKFLIACSCRRGSYRRILNNFLTQKVQQLGSIVIEISIKSCNFLVFDHIKLTISLSN
ncbi:hypothetical protein BpHYR1_050373 [Brachionus plicatilis]|uniref:Uncharacterized protein n=1 Tax=Brachionus plicatilis TaxID=10195 RepID=A0A3M7SV96_BRAPC|nr:hypothetical protein BpHYR1_050373 [Brachionus plicatilis]